ncbi:hypothetical protein cypCar_00039834 [Cyprinus carpio]|nr:hypothetical protein cypCar_00039834 [Cyprinus carpio]
MRTVFDGGNPDSDPPPSVGSLTLEKVSRAVTARGPTMTPGGRSGRWSACKTEVRRAGDRPTCRNCDDNCNSNILKDIIDEKKLTSGYFGFNKKPGKCSHGDFLDFSSLLEPRGGINKDTHSSSHGYLHEAAARVAIAATRELLEDIRGSLGDSNFLRLMGFSQSSVLCFAIDTTGSMGDDIDEVRRVTSDITDRMRDTVSEYILVPFNDPDFGPLIRTTDPDEFKLQINALEPHDGGDTPELCLSGLRLALTGSPPQTKIFVFTDADAKDKELKSTILALIESTKSVVRITSDSQTNEELNGTLGLVEHVGNFYTVRLTILDQVGLWNIKMSSLQPYTIKVLGQSDIDFLFNFVELSEGAHSGYSVLSGRLPANRNVTLLLTIMGGDTVTPTEVALVKSSDSQSINGTLEKLADGKFLVTVNSVPAGEFVVRVMGERSSSRSSNGRFQRQSITQQRTSSLVITITDFTSPVCEIVSVNANCSGNCSLSSWELSANLTDGNGTGIKSLTLRQGLGTLNTTTRIGGEGVNVTLAFYRASCCSEVMELVAVDGAGNVGICVKSITSAVTTTANTFMYTTSTTNSMTTTTATTTTSTPSTNATSYSAGCIFDPPISFWVGVGAFLLFHVLCF